MKIVLIAAMNYKKVIGNNGFLPWSCSEDLSFFKEKTLGKHILVGSNTKKTLPTLQNRIVHTLTSKPKSDMDFSSVQEVLDYKCDELWVCGGSTLYDQFLDKADTLYLSTINDYSNGDTFFPYDKAFKTLKDRSVIRHNNNLTIEKWDK